MTITNNALTNGKTEIYTLELFTIGEPKNDLLEWIAQMPKVKGVFFESNPNKEHDSILVDIEVDYDDTDMLEMVVDHIEFEYYSKHEVIDCYEYYNTCMEW